MKIWLCAAVCLFFSLFSAAQGPAANGFVPDSAVYRMFDKKVPVLWVKYFSGRLDDVSDVSLTLGFDGKNCRGFLAYAESRDRLRLDGTLTDSTVSLRESVLPGEATGFLRGTLANGRLAADWTNHNNTIGSRLECEEVGAAQASITHCGDNKWINRYAATLNSARFEVALCRANNGQLYGSAWTEVDNQTYLLKGQIAPSGEYALAMSRRDGSAAGTLVGTLLYLQNLDATWVSTSGGQQAFNFYLKETYAMGCNEYADFASSFDVLYPKTKCSTCNTWLERQVATWANGCKSIFSEKKQEPQSPANRAARRASGWPDIALWTDELLCGTLTFEESWEDAPHGMAFNFNLRTGSEITLNDLFIKNFDARAWLDEYAKKESPKLPIAAQPRAQEWLQKTGFPLLLLRRDGLALSAPFHPVFGQQTLLIPYATLKPYLRKDSPVAVFVK